MKILFIHERFGAWGGAEANILLTAREMKRRGHQVSLLHGNSTRVGEKEWFETFSRSYLLDGAGSSSFARSLIAHSQPDVLYVHKMSDLSVLEALAESGFPVVRMVHDHDLYCMRSYKYNPLTREICHRAASLYCMFPCGGCVGKGSGFLPLGWKSYRAKKRELNINRRFAQLIVASQYMKQELVRNGFEPEKIGIYPPVPQPMKVGKPSSFSERNVILYAGQVIRGKGVDVLLEALRQVEVPYQCQIFGEGNHLKTCRGLAQKLGIANRVQFHGFVPQEKLADYYSEATLGVVSSVWPEPFGAVGLEAMSHGLPVVAFDAGGIREWLISAYNGFLVPWMDKAAFAQRVQQLLCDKALAKQMGERAQRLVRQKYDFGKYVAGLESLFQGLQARSRERMGMAA